MNTTTLESNHRILLIDDNRSIHEDFRKILGGEDEKHHTLDKARAAFFDEPQVLSNKASFQLDSAYQGEEGIATLQQSLDDKRPYAMAFIDVRMPPGIDGIETARRLWEIYPQLQVVICTAYSDYSWEEMIGKVGNSDQLLILKKPFEAIEVLQLVHALTKKWSLSHDLTGRLSNLETLVSARTHQLASANLQLCNEMAERVRVDAQVRDQASLLDKARDAILVRDLDDVILYWNAGAVRLYGWRAEEAIGRKATDLLYKNLLVFTEARRSVIENGEWIGELRHQTKDGRELSIEGHWTLVLNDEGKPKSILSINTDISERKLLEGQLLRSQRMESIGLLAGGIAHDLNNVLGPIMMALEILQSRFPDSDSRHIIEVLGDSAHRGAGMVKQVLQFARGVEGEHSLIDPGHVAREVYNAASETFPKNIQVRHEIASDLWCATADPTQIHQVLLNLCVNARDALPTGGLLTISADNVTIDPTFAVMSPGAKAGPYVCLQVSDTGLGMSAAVIERIFEPFFTTKEIGKGTGLGLSSSIGIVKSHGGFVDVQSVPGQGSTFKVYIPAIINGAIPAGLAAADLPCGNGELVLVVDDEAAIRAITSDTLQEFGYRVLVAEDGAEACALFAQHSRDVSVVLTDLLMPIMDGPATVRALRRMDPHLPIIAASGFSSIHDTSLAREAGVLAFIAKPYRTETLLTILRDTLANQLPRPVIIPLRTA